MTSYQPLEQFRKELSFQILSRNYPLIQRAGIQKSKKSVYYRASLEPWMIPVLCTNYPSHEYEGNRKDSIIVPVSGRLPILGL